MMELPGTTAASRQRWRPALRRSRVAAACATALGAPHQRFPGPEPPAQPLKVAGDGASVSQDGGSGPIGSRATSHDSRRSAASGCAAQVGLRPPAVSVRVSSWTLNEKLISTLMRREVCFVAEEYSVGEHLDGFLPRAHFPFKERSSVGGPPTRLDTSRPACCGSDRKQQVIRPSSPSVGRKLYRLIAYGSCRFGPVERRRGK